MTELQEWLFGTEPIAAFQQFIGLGHPLPFDVFSMLGDTWGIIFVIGVALWLFGRKQAYAVVGVVIAGAITKVVLSDLFYHQRPQGPGIVVYEHLDVGSFPSGHMYEGLAPWGLLYVLGCVPFWIPVAVAILIGAGRLYLGAHFIGDLIGGIVFAIPLIWLYARSWPTLWGWLRERSYRFYLGAALVLLAGTWLWIMQVGDHPRRYQVIGMLIGGTLGLLAEYRFVRYRPSAERLTQRTLAVLVGLAGITVFLLWTRSTGDQALLLGTLTSGLAMLWSLVLTPALLEALRPEHRNARSSQSSLE